MVSVALGRDDGGPGRVVLLRPVRLGGLQLDFLLPACAGNRSSRNPHRSSRLSTSVAPARAGSDLPGSAGMTRLLGSALSRVQQVDTLLSRRSGRRRILVDARTPVNYTMVAPVVRTMAADPRIAFYFTASEEPARLTEIYREAPGVRTIEPRRAALMKFDAYVA